MPNRDHLRRLSTVWLRQPVYFLTACTAGRRRLLAAPAPATIRAEAWRSAPARHGWSVGRYVIMPDHVHFFARPAPGGKALGEFLRDWKRWTSRGILRLGGLPPGAVLWQPEFFDHLLRSPASYGEKWNYVRENPVRAGLVARAEDWPYAGECEFLEPM